MADFADGALHEKKFETSLEMLWKKQEKNKSFFNKTITLRGLK